MTTDAEPFPEIDIIEVWRGALTGLRDHGKIAGSIDAGMLKRLAVEMHFHFANHWPMPGLADFLAELSLRPVHVGIVSNDWFYGPLNFEAQCGRPPADAGFEPELTAWSFEVGAAKPSPRIFQGVLNALEKRYGIQPHQTLFVGNSMLCDVYGAKQAGMLAALIAADTRCLDHTEHNPPGQGLRPDVLITELRQLLEVLPALDTASLPSLRAK